MGQNPRIGGSSSEIARVGEGAQPRTATRQPLSGQQASVVRRGSTAPVAGISGVAGGPSVATPGRESALGGTRGSAGGLVALSPELLERFEAGGGAAPPVDFMPPGTGPPAPIGETPAALPGRELVRSLIPALQAIGLGTAATPALDDAMTLLRMAGSTTPDTAGALRRLAELQATLPTGFLRSVQELEGTLGGGGGITDTIAQIRALGGEFAPGFEAAQQALSTISGGAVSPELQRAQEIFDAIASGEFTGSEAFQQAVIQPVLATLADAGVSRSGVAGGQVAEATIPFVLGAARDLAQSALQQQAQQAGAAGTLGQLGLGQQGQLGQLLSQAAGLGLQERGQTADIAQTLAGLGLQERGLAGTLASQQLQGALADLGRRATAGATLGQLGLAEQGQQLGALGQGIQTGFQGLTTEEQIASSLLGQLAGFGAQQQAAEQGGVTQLQQLAQAILLGPLTQTLLPGTIGQVSETPSTFGFGIPGVFSAQK